MSALSHTAFTRTAPADTVRLLLLLLTLLLSADNAGNTAADVALSLNDEECYRVIRDAGVRSGVPVFAIHSFLRRLTSGLG